LPGFREIESPHAEVHRYAMEALRAYTEHDASRVLKNISGMEAASLKVISGLELMVTSGERDTSLLCSH